MRYAELNQYMGNIDLHVLDQILKGRYEPSMRVLDAGCGEGRNLPYFVRNGFDVWGVDVNPMALRLLRAQGRGWNAAFDPEKFIEADLAELPFPPACFDAIVCCAVLHFARHEQHFFDMMTELTRVLRPGGSLFIRTAVPHHPPTGHPSESLPYFLLTPQLIRRLVEDYPLDWLEPMRTEQVVGHTAQSTLVLQQH